MSGAGRRFSRWPSGLLAAAGFGALLVFAAFAPEFLPDPDPSRAWQGPGEMPPFGADDRGRSLWVYATQGASILAWPALLAGFVVALLAVFGGVVRATGAARLDGWVQGMGEVVGALPRMVVVLVVALIVPADSRSLYPLAVTWALLAAPGAMDEAAAVAERLGGSRFVEALRAHGYSAARIFLLHIVGYNLRPVVVRQAAEVSMQVVFLELALSYLALAGDRPSLTHADSVMSWAGLLSQGYTWLVIDMESGHALALGLGLIALVTGASLAVSHAARAR